MSKQQYGSKIYILGEEYHWKKNIAATLAPKLLLSAPLDLSGLKIYRTKEEWEGQKSEIWLPSWRAPYEELHRALMSSFGIYLVVLNLSRSNRLKDYRLWLELTRRPLRKEFMRFNTILISVDSPPEESRCLLDRMSKEYDHIYRTFVCLPRFDRASRKKVLDLSREPLSRLSACIKEIRADEKQVVSERARKLASRIKKKLKKGQKCVARNQFNNIKKKDRKSLAEELERLLCGLPTQFYFTESAGKDELVWIDSHDFIKNIMALYRAYEAFMINENSDRGGNDVFNSKGEFLPTLNELKQTCINLNNGKNEENGNEPAFNWMESTIRYMRDLELLIRGNDDSIIIPEFLPFSCRLTENDDLTLAVTYDLELQMDYDMLSYIIFKKFFFKIYGNNDYRLIRFWKNKVVIENRRADRIEVRWEPLAERITLSIRGKSDPPFAVKAIRYIFKMIHEEETLPHRISFLRDWEGVGFRNLIVDTSHYGTAAVYLTESDVERIYQSNEQSLNGMLKLTQQDKQFLNILTGRSFE